LGGAKKRGIRACDIARLFLDEADMVDDFTTSTLTHARS
jgi:hypothetical protein